MFFPREVPLDLWFDPKTKGGIARLSDHRSPLPPKPPTKAQQKRKRPPPFDMYNTLSLNMFKMVREGYPGFTPDDWLDEVNGTVPEHSPILLYREVGEVCRSPPSTLTFSLPLSPPLSHPSRAHSHPPSLTLTVRARARACVSVSVSV